MRLLNVISSTNPEHGGVIEWVRQFGVAATQMGHIIEIASMDPLEAPWIADSPIPVHAFGQKLKNFYSPGLVSWLKQNHRNYDAVIVHGLWRYPSFATWIALRKAETPYFIYTHGMLGPWFKKNHPIKHAGKWLYWPWTDYRALKDATGVIFTCEQEKRNARESFWLYQAKELVATIGIDSPTGDVTAQKQNFHEAFPETQSKHNILFLGRIHPVKGCDLLIKSFAKVVEKKNNLHLVMAGPDNMSWTTQLKEIAHKEGITDKITWTGMIKGDLKWGAFHAAEAFILPSHHENFGNTIVEAMACSTPVLITNKVNIFTEIEADQAGFVEEDTQSGTDNLLLKWLHCPHETRKAMSKNALDCYLKRFEASNATKLLLNLLRTNITSNQ